VVVKTGKDGGVSRRALVTGGAAAVGGAMLSVGLKGAEAAEGKVDATKVRGTR
jgi:hypothetical protein